MKRENDGARERLMNIYFLSKIGPRLACMRTSRKTSARLKITFVDMTYPKGWTGSLLLCPLIFSCRNHVQTFVCNQRGTSGKRCRRFLWILLRVKNLRTISSESQRCNDLHYASALSLSWDLEYANEEVELKLFH